MNPSNTWRSNEEKIILFDNGAYEIKHSSGGKHSFKRKFHNCKFFEKTNNTSSMNSSAPLFIQDIKRDYPIENLSSIGRNYLRPLSRGLLSDIDLQLDIWEKIFQTHYSMEAGDETFKENMFIFTHTPMAPDEIIEGFFEIIFEYFGFDACFKAIHHVFAAWYYKEKYQDNINSTVQLVVDSGFSSTTIVPIFDDMPIYNAIKRVEIGGKLLTNYLKECLVNTIDLDLRKEFYLANLIKEECCYISKDFCLDMKISKETEMNKKQFILPEYRKKPESFLNSMAPEKYMINLNNLRFVVPELIFNPNMIGIEEGGLHEGIIQSINDCHCDYKNLLFENIITTGGNSKFAGFNERLIKELNSTIDHDYVKTARIFTDKGIKDSSCLSSKESKQNEIVSDADPVIEGMRLFAQNRDLLADLAITKKDYDEIGFNIVWKTCY